MSEAYKSTDDRRATDASPQASTTGSVAGGAFRSVYRPLTDGEKDLVDRVKLKGEEFFALIAEAGGTDPASERTGSASLTLAFRHVEDAVYRTVKHITGPKAA
ncbi:hypothetical protein [Methylosinus sp. PW1]|uniref:Acb2/Tad1 domain-containing protein n=1 Tax=Methylosinus sp. PW1 TaxID=107636 RepID=UPI000563549E|nr:hypothetical protein [Methylosinus sp. PW1]